MKIHNDITQGTPEWHALRNGRFTCSDGQAISTNGKGLETLAFEKCAEIVTGKSKEFYVNDSMERGSELELLARNAYEIETGLSVKQVGFVEYSKYVGGSPDGMINDDGLMEVKCPTSRVFVEYLYYKKIDPKYHYQMQMQMYITDRKWCDYVVYNPDFPKPLIITRVERNEDDIKKLVEGIAKGVEKIQEILKSI